MRRLAALLGCLHFVLFVACGRTGPREDAEGEEQAPAPAAVDGASASAGEIAALALSADPHAGDGTPKPQLRVMSWNLEWFPGRAPASSETDKLIHLTAAREVLAGQAPDILCVQEVLDAVAVEQMAEALPGFKVHVVSQFEGAQQIAIASRIPPVSAYFRKFAVAGASPPRGFAFAAYREGNDYLLVYSVHLKSNRGGIAENMAKREESARQLVAHMKEASEDFRRQGAREIAVVMAGDFNTDPGDKRFATESTGRILADAGLARGWEGIPFAERVTWPGDGTFPDACFDHFYSRGLVNAGCLLVPGSEIASDHRAVILGCDRIVNSTPGGSGAPSSPGQSR